MPPRRPIRVVLKSSSSSSGTASTTASTTPTTASRVESDLEEDSDVDLSLSISEDDNSDEYDGEDGFEEVKSSPKRLTARQRAIHEQDTEPVRQAPVVSVPIMSPSSRKSGKRQLTEEEQLMESEKQRKRKHLRDQKLEDSKRAIVERLLQKQSTRSKKSQKTIQSIDNQQQQQQQNTGQLSGDEVGHEVIVPLDVKCEKYVSRRDGEYYIANDAVGKEKETKNTITNSIKCSVKGCVSEKRCSVRNRPTCGSLECYQKLCK